jgi:spore coat polysaccharide biosynthesis predicted glycosyltransferase SpsG
MADRIVKTQEIQSQNLAATQKLAQYAMTLTDEQVTATRESVQNNMNAGMSNMNMSQMQTQQAPAQGTIQMH